MSLKCYITGTSGYVGSVLKNYLSKQGLDIFSLVRSNDHYSEKDIYFNLREKFNAANFSNCDVLIHCAYDFKATSWQDIKSKNIDPSIKLITQAKERGVKKIIFISSISAFENCHSLYGKAKLEIENFVLSVSGAVIRPALVYGDSSGGMVGSLRNSIGHSSIVPVVGAGQKMFLCHEEDLANLVFKIIENDQIITTPIIAASSLSWKFIDILKKLASKLNKKPKFILLPWQLVWVAIKSVESLGLKLNFRSDSLISLMNPNSQPDFSGAEKFGVSFRPFA